MVTPINAAAASRAASAPPMAVAPPARKHRRTISTPTATAASAPSRSSAWVTMPAGVANGEVFLKQALRDVVARHRQHRQEQRAADGDLGQLASVGAAAPHQQPGQRRAPDRGRPRSAP